jgi:hypothetical protein
MIGRNKMSIGCKWNWHNTGHQVWYDKTTFETLENTYPLQFYDDFLGAAGGSVFDGTNIWNVVDVGAGTAAIEADQGNGIFRLEITNAGAAEDATLYHNDNRTFDVTNGVIFETKIDVSTLLTTAGTVEGVIGMCGNHNLDNDTIQESAWFKLDGAGTAIACETDDNVAINNDDITTGISAVAGTPNIYRIDFTTLSDVKFFIDGVRVCTSTTFDLSALTGAAAVLQPYIGLDCAADASLGIFDIDYVKILSNRA